MKRIRLYKTINYQLELYDNGRKSIIFHENYTNVNFNDWKKKNQGLLINFFRK